MTDQAATDTNIGESAQPANSHGLRPRALNRSHCSTKPPPCPVQTGMAAVPKPPSNLSTGATATGVHGKIGGSKAMSPSHKKFQGQGCRRLTPCQAAANAATLQLLREGVFWKIITAMLCTLENA